MKHILFLAVLALFASGIKAQDTLSLSLELVNPSGELGLDSYFQARLKNHSDSLRVLFGCIPQEKFISVCDNGGEGIKERSLNYLRQSFFDFTEKKVVVIEPNSEYIRGIPFFIISTGSWNSQGIFPHKAVMIRKTKRIKIKLEGLVFQFDPVKLVSVSQLRPLTKVNLESNWLDVDAEAIARLAQQITERSKSQSQ